MPLHYDYNELKTLRVCIVKTQVVNLAELMSG